MQVVLRAQIELMVICMIVLGNLTEELGFIETAAAKGNRKRLEPCGRFLRRVMQNGRGI